MYFIYRYMDSNEVIYVGITANLQERIRQHKHDKLSGYTAVEYFAVKHKCDADLLETYLISKYNTKRYFNVSKTQKGDVSFLDGICFPWIPYDGKVKSPIQPFILTQKQTQQKRNDDLKIIKDIRYFADRVNEEYEIEKNIISAINNEIVGLSKKDDAYEIKIRYLRLRNIRLSKLYRIKRKLAGDNVIASWDDIHLLAKDVAGINKDINNYTLLHFGITAIKMPPQERALRQRQKNKHKHIIAQEGE